MSNNVAFVTGVGASPPASLTVETLDQGGGVQRQVIHVGSHVSSTEKWVAGSGVGLTWTAAFTSSTLNSISNGNAILSDLQIDNSTAFDLFCVIEVVLASLTTTSGAPYIGVYLYLLNSDASTYGDGRFGSSASGPPPSQYYVGAVPLIPSVTQAQQGTISGILLPPGKFKFVAYNQSGAALASSGNTFKYRTYNRSIS